MELPQGGASEHVSKPCPGNFPTEGTIWFQRELLSSSPSPPPRRIICSLHFTVGSFFQIYFLWCFFFSPAAFFSCKSMLRLEQQQLLCWSSQHTPAGKYFPARFLKTLQSQEQNLPQRVAKEGSTLITQLGAGERGRHRREGDTLLRSSGKEASRLRKKHLGSGQVSTIDAISKAISIGR